MNLFQPGVSGNPAGKPKGAISTYREIQKQFAELLSENVKVGSGKNATTQLAYVAWLRGMVARAIKGSGRDSETLAKYVLKENTLEDLDNWINRGMRENDEFKVFQIQTLRSFTKQRQILQLIPEEHNNRIYLMCGRRAGKTTLNEYLLVQTMILKAPARVLYIGLTIQKAIDLIYDNIIDLLYQLGIPTVNPGTSRSLGVIKLSNGSELHIAGNSSSAEREKARGPYWDLIIIDEAQSQDNQEGGPLRYFIESILEPTLIDHRGTLVMTGTGPRTRGILWAQVWENEGNRWPGFRMNWNLLDNPMIEKGEEVLSKIRQDHNWNENNNTFIREYLGKVSYDDDALVYRLTKDNFYTKEELRQWILQQPITDIRFTAGLDYGFVTSDAFVMVVWSLSSDKKFLVAEYKKNRSGWAELIQDVKNKVDEVLRDPIYSREEIIMPQDPRWDTTRTMYTPYAEPQKLFIEKDFKVWAEYATGGQKTAVDFRREGIPVVDAYKANKAQSVELLREEVLSRNLKVPEGGIFQEETLYTVFGRDENDNLTREIDDKLYHPDLADALLYAFHIIWVNSKKRNE